MDAACWWRSTAQVADSAEVVLTGDQQAVLQWRTSESVKSDWSRWTSSKKEAWCVSGPPGCRSALDTSASTTVSAKAERVQLTKPGLAAAAAEPLGQPRPAAQPFFPTPSTHPSAIASHPQPGALPCLPCSLVALLAHHHLTPCRLLAAGWFVVPSRGRPVCLVPGDPVGLSPSPVLSQPSHLAANPQFEAWPLFAPEQQQPRPPCSQPSLFFLTLCCLFALWSAIPPHPIPSIIPSVHPPAAAAAAGIQRLALPGLTD